MKKLKFALYFVLMYLFARAEILDGLRPFESGLFFALVYAGENLAYMAPLYIAAAFLAAPSLGALLTALGSAAALGLLYYGAFRLKKHVNAAAVTGAAFIVRIPGIIISAGDAGALTDSLIVLIFALIFTFACAVAAFALIKRGTAVRLTRDEAASAGIAAAVFGAALVSIRIYDYTPLFTLAAFIIVTLAADSAPAGLASAALIGLGAAFGEGEIGIAAGLMLSALAAMMFIRMPVIFSAMAYLAADLAAGLYFKAYGDYGMVHFFSVAAGLIGAVFVPGKAHEQIRIYLKNTRGGLAPRSVVNMMRYELSSEIGSVARAFADIGAAVRENTGGQPTPEALEAAVRGEIARRACGDCSRREDCYNERSGRASELFGGIVKGAAEKGRATLVDVPPLLTSICKRVNAVLQAANELTGVYAARLQTVRNSDKARLLLAEQSSGIASLMDTLSIRIGKGVAADKETEERIVEELAYRNIVCSEAMVWSGENSRGITLIVRNSDRDKKNIDKILYGLTGTPWVRSDIKCEHTEGLTSVTFLPSTQYEILIGECMATKTGSILSGDTRSVMRIGHDRIMLALCDGMGSGREAESDSSAALAMVENLYKAGFDSSVILSLANNLLAESRENESFSALDIAIADLNACSADFIKMGAASGFIRTEQGVEEVEGGALPMGIVGEMRPSVHSRRLKTGELCLMVSDGVADTIGPEGIDRILIDNSALNPQAVANEIVRTCLSRGIKDDVTAVAFRLYRKI